MVPECEKRMLARAEAQTHMFSNLLRLISDDREAERIGFFGIDAEISNCASHFVRCDKPILR